MSAYYSKAYLRHLIKSKEYLGLTIASIHNLSFYLWLWSARQGSISLPVITCPGKNDMVVRLQKGCKGVEKC